MCGIGGIFHFDPKRPVVPETLVGMAAIQNHRGPDGFGWHRLEDRGVGFCHARLAIIDLCKSGHQPLALGDLLLTHNGEFYDYQRLRATLTAQGRRFKSKTDSEIVLHLYAHFGFETMLTHLRGEFAFALYDRRQDALYLVRDRFGIKPLYWTQTDESIVFGSEIKVLYAHPQVKRGFDAAGVYHQLMQTMVPGTTPYRGVHQVKPGYFLRITRDTHGFQVKELRYWDMDFPRMGERNDGVAESHMVEAVRAKLLEAVQHRLVADVPVGCYLSGGIDSCSILGLASACRQDPVKAFTIGFDSSEYDESHIAAQMAQSVGADQDQLMLDAGHLYDHFEETHWHTERTIYNTLGVAKMLMSRHVRAVNYKVVLTGEGSDELFGGYPSFRRDLFLHGLDHLPREERRRMESMLAQNNALFKGAMLADQPVHDEALEARCGFTPSCLQPWLAAAKLVPAILGPDLAETLRGYRPGHAIAQALDPAMMQGRHPLDIAQYVWVKTMLEGQILTWGGDRVDMANSMEARPPFLDHHLAELAVHVPPHLRIKGPREKHVLRQAMRGLLPEVLVHREKFAFMAPPAHTDRRKMQALSRLAGDYLHDQALHDSGLLNPQGVAALLQAYRHAQTPRAELVQLDAVINHMLGVQILHRHLVARDIPALAQERARHLGWHP